MANTDTGTGAGRLETISVLLPTRQRPDILRRMLESLYESSENPGLVETILYVDSDDLETADLELGKWNVKRIVGPRQAMGALNTACLKESSGDIIILGNDDIIVRTPGWDRRICEAVNEFTDRIYLLYPNDLFKEGKLATFPILSKTACDAIGDPFPAIYRGAFIDVHLMDIFKKLEGYGQYRIKYLQDVVFEHMHYRLGKSLFDEVYFERTRFGDDRSFMQLDTTRAQAAQRLSWVIGKSSARPIPDIDGNGHQGASFVSLTWGILAAGRSPWTWRIYLFAWLWARRLYSRIKGISSRSTL